MDNFFGGDNHPLARLLTPLIWMELILILEEAQISIRMILQGKKMYLTAVTQCPYPDAWIEGALKRVHSIAVWSNFTTHPPCQYSSRDLGNLESAWNHWTSYIYSSYQNFLGTSCCSCRSWNWHYSSGCSYFKICFLPLNVLLNMDA